MLKPIDIQEKEFEIKMRGYDRDEVDDFLDEVIDTFDILYKTNKSLQQQVDALEKEKAQASEARESVELARYQCEEMKKQAKAEAERILNEAKNSAANSQKGIETEFLRKQEMILKFKEEIADFKKNIRQNCSELLSVLDKMD